MTDNYMKIHPDDWRQLLGDIEQLRKERDDARQDACKFATVTELGSRAYARNRGWDCFKEETP